MCTPATLPGCFGDADFAMPDPGSAVALPRSAGRAYIGFVTGASGETNTLADPVKAGQELVLYLRTDGGGDRVVTVASAFDIAGNTVLTFANAGEYAAFVSVAVGTSWKWKLVASNILSGLGATLAEIALLSGLTATAAELNRTCDVSGRTVTHTTSTLSVDQLSHDGKTIVLDRAAGIAVTLPNADSAAVGCKFRFVVKTTFTGAATIKSSRSADIMIGHARMGNNSDNTTVDWQSVAADTNDTIALFGTANSTGGIEGQIVEIECIAANTWFVEIVGDAAGTEATPFANTVA